jgi:hypothetical protein
VWRDREGMEMLLQSRCSAAWATLPVNFALVILEFA